MTALVEILEQIHDLTPADKPSWDGNVVLRLAVQRLWISAGNCAEEYRRASQINPGVEPWAELAGYRNRRAHALPGDLSSDRIWTDTATDLGPSSLSCTASAEPGAVIAPTPRSALR